MSKRPKTETVNLHTHERNEVEPDTELYWTLIVVRLEIMETIDELTREKTAHVNSIIALNNPFIIQSQLQHFIDAAVHTYLEERKAALEDNQDKKERTIVIQDACIMNIMPLGAMTHEAFFREHNSEFGVFEPKTTTLEGETSH